MKGIFTTILLVAICHYSNLAQTLSGGSNHSLIICGGDEIQSGEIQSWGFNNYGQLGQGSNTGVFIPTEISGFTNAIAVDGGAMHTLILKSNGEVWAMGENGTGQLGKGDTSDTNLPVQITGISNVKAIAAGWEHSVALKNDSTVWCWGYNEYGQLGLGDMVNRNIPVQVLGLTNVVAIAAGKHHTLAVKSDGTVWSWGWNPLGQLGNSSTVNSSSPVQVIGLTGITEVAGGDWHSMALKNDGTVWSWGHNTYGQLGKGTNNWSDSVATMIAGLNSVSKIATGRFHSMVLKTDGTIWTWGLNAYGVMGDGTHDDYNVPHQVAGLTSIINMDAGGEHSLALKNDGSLWAWGLNGNGQLGDGNFATESVVPVLVGSPCGVMGVGVEDAESVIVNIYPNPANEYVMIDAGDNVEVKNISLYSSDGKKIMNDPYCAGCKVNLGNLSLGVYVICLETDHGTLIRRLIKGNN